MPPLFIYSDAYQRFDYGPHHPLQVNRLKLTADLIRAYDLLPKRKARWVETRQATETEALAYHTWDYLQVLRQANTGQGSRDLALYGLGPGDNPVFCGVLDWGLYLCRRGPAGRRVGGFGEGAGGLSYGRRDAPRP